MDMSSATNESWDDLVKKILEAIVDRLKEEGK